MRRAVSTRPLRAPGVAMKYSSIARPSRKFDLIGRGIMSPRGLATRPRMPAIWRTCIMFPRAPEPTIMSMGLNFSALRSFSIAWRDLLGGLGPDLDFLLAPLAVGDDAPAEVAPPLLGLLLVLGRGSSAFSGGVFTSSIEMVRPDWAA